MSRSQFHQHFTCTFFIWKCFFCLNVTREKHFSTKNVQVKCWWNWHQELTKVKLYWFQVEIHILFFVSRVMFLWWNYFLCAQFGYLYFLSFHKWTRIKYINWPGMALTPFPSSVGWDVIRTHDLLVINLVCYPLDQSFAYCDGTNWY